MASLKLKPHSRYSSYDTRSSTSSHFSDPSSSTEQLNKQLKLNSSSSSTSSKALIVKSSKPSDLSSHTKSRPSNPNLATMVKKFMEKKPSSSSSKAVKMVIPSDVIAEDLKKTARKGTSFKGLHKKLFGAGNETTVFDSKKKKEVKALTEVKENTRTLAMVLRSERELLGMNKEQEMEISQLKFMLEEKSTEVSDSVGLFFFCLFLFWEMLCLDWEKGRTKKRKESGKFGLNIFSNFYNCYYWLI